MRISAFGARTVASAGALALVAGLGVAVAMPATATEGPTPVAVDSVELTWGLSDEAGGGAFFGGCNFLSAGTAGNSGSSRLWTEADAFYRTVDGNVTVEKPDAAGEYGQPTWATRCQNPSGAPVSAASPTNVSKNRVRFSAGEGTVDVASGTASIAWDGDVTVVFYGGLTYWTASDPELTVTADGVGTLTATASGYGASQTDTSQWVALEPREITLATLTDVDVTRTGLTVTPDYLGVEVDGVAQTRTGTAWGSFPQDFVDFQQLTGQSSYWYSSGGARDAAKPATPLEVAWTIWEPRIEASQTTGFDPDGTTSVTVTGTGFDPLANVATRVPVGAGNPAGVYVVFGRFAESWRPSQGGTGRNVIDQKWPLPEPSYTSVLTGFPSTAAQLVPLAADGSFTTTLTVRTDDTKTGSYGFYTFAAGGSPANAAQELALPVTFDVRPTIAQGPADERVREGDVATFDVAATGGDVDLAYAWQRSDDEGLTWSAVAGATSATLSFTTASTDNGALFRSVVSSGAAKVTSSAARLVVDIPGLVVTAEPADTTVTVGSSAAFTVSTTGRYVDHRWQTSADEGATWTDVADADSRRLTVPTTSRSQSGTLYRAVLTNPAGTVETASARLTVTKASPVLTVTAPATAVAGKAVVVTAEVAGPAGVATPTGKVTVRLGSKVLGTGGLTSGSARVTIAGGKLAVGTRTLVVTYSGDTDHRSATAKAVVAVTKATATVTAAPSRTTLARNATSSVAATVRSTGLPATGTVTVTWRSPGGTSLTRTVALSDGRATAVSPRLTQAGRWKVTAVYAGSATVARASSTVTTVTVR